MAMVDVYKFHTNPEQLTDYEPYAVREEAKRQERLAKEEARLARLMPRYNQPGMPAPSAEYTRAVAEIKDDFFEFHLPDDFRLEEYERVVNGVRVTSFTMDHPRGHDLDEVAFRLDVVDQEAGGIKLYDPNSGDLTGQYDSLNDAAEGGIIFDNLDYVIAHYREYV